MKRQKHIHRDSFSILVISHIGREGRQFHISPSSVRFLFWALFVICAAVLWLIIQLPVSYRQNQDLKDQLATRDEAIRALEEEKQALSEEKQALARENEFLLLAGKSDTLAEASAPAGDEEEESDSDPAIPHLSPSSEMGMLMAAYTEDAPYISINTHTENNLIAAGDGTVSAITNDETYPLIIELEHGNGYKTRYMCRQMAELRLEENTRVKAGDILAVITFDNTQLDYQVVFEDEPIDPLNVIDAKG